MHKVQHVGIGYNLITMNGRALESSHFFSFRFVSYFVKAVSMSAASLGKVARNPKVPKNKALISFNQVHNNGTLSIWC